MADPQEGWKISLPLLHKKTGSSSHARGFKSMIRELAEHDHLPDYRVRLQENRLSAQPKPNADFPVLTPEDYHDARQVALSYDVYFLEQEWRN